MSASSSTEGKDQTIPWAWVRAVSDILDCSADDDLSCGPARRDTSSLPTEIVPWLYLSGEYKVRKYAAMTQGNPLGITHVLTTNSMDEERYLSLLELLSNADIEHCAISALDLEGFDLIDRHWSECLEFLKNVKRTKNGKVIVHCLAGVNRSGLIASAAVMVIDRRPLLDVVRLIKKKRGFILNNKSFQRQLCVLAARENLLGEKPRGYSDEPVEQEEEMEVLSF